MIRAYRGEDFSLEIASVEMGSERGIKWPSVSAGKGLGLGS